MPGRFVLKTGAERQDFDWGTFRWISRPAATGAKDLIVCRVTVFSGKGHNFHRHPRQEEVIHVLEGKMEQWLECEKRILGPGDSVFIARDTVHASFNVGSADLEVVAILGPAVGAEGYELVDASAEAPWSTLRK
jgi:quercetin dioxygenase-like cupin family protein